MSFFLLSRQIWLLYLVDINLLGNGFDYKPKPCSYYMYMYKVGSIRTDSYT